jgi:hypothetical protein
MFTKNFTPGALSYSEGGTKTERGLSGNKFRGPGEKSRDRRMVKII